MAIVTVTEAVKDLDGAPIQGPLSAAHANSVLELVRAALEGGVPDPLVIISRAVNAEAQEPLTVRSVCCQALLRTDAKEENSAESSLERWDLARRIHDKDKVELRAEDVTLLKQLIGKVFVPAVVGPVILALDPEALGKKE